MFISYSFHELDLELRTVINQYTDGLNLIKEFKDNWQTKDECIRQINSSVRDYCNHWNIDFDKTIHITVDSKCGEPYRLYLSYLLVCYPKYNIPSLLTHHLEQYHNSKSEFLETVRSYVVKMIYQLSPFDNSDRLDRIMDWCMKERKATIKTDKPGTNKTKYNIQLRLDWNPKYLNVLDLLSKKLSPDYTPTKKSFTKVFTENTPTIWKKNKFTFLTVLLFVLKRDKYFFVLNGETKSNGYYKAANNLFAYDTHEKYASNYFPNTLSKIKNKRPLQYTMLLSKAEKLIASCKV